MDDTHAIYRAPTAAWRMIDGQVAIISTDVNRVRVLNGVGSFVWERCDGASIGAVIEAVCRDFAVDRETATRDVGAFVTDMVTRGMLVVRTGDGQ